MFLVPAVILAFTNHRLERDYQRRQEALGRKIRTLEV